MHISSKWLNHPPSSTNCFSNTNLPNVSVLGEVRSGVSGTAMMDSQRADFGLLMAQIGRVPWVTKEFRKA